MTRSLIVLLLPTLLTLLPSPAIPAPASPLIGSQVDNVWGDIQDLMDQLLDARLSPTVSLSDSLDHRSPSGDVTQDRFQPGPSKPRSLWSFPGSSSASREYSVRTMVDSAPAPAPVSLLTPAFQKRGRLSLCYMAGFSTSDECPEENRGWRVPQTRSGSAVQTPQRKSSPSLYLFGGAIGR